MGRWWVGGRRGEGRGEREETGGGVCVWGGGRRGERGGSGVDW